MLAGPARRARLERSGGSEERALHVLRALGLSGALLAILLSLLALACGGEHGLAHDEVLGSSHRFASFEAFEAKVSRDPETGVYIVDGDTVFETREQLRSFYDEMESGKARMALIISNNGIRRWEDSKKLRLTYCVSTAFGDNYSTVAQAMRDAARSWQNASFVRYFHRSDQDSRCSASNPHVVFDVRPVDGLSNALAPDQKIYAVSFSPKAGARVPSTLGLP